MCICKQYDVISANTSVLVQTALPVFLWNFVCERANKREWKEICASKLPAIMTKENHLSLAGPEAQFLRKWETCVDGVHHRHSPCSSTQSRVRKLLSGKHLHGWSKESYYFEICTTFIQGRFHNPLWNSHVLAVKEKMKAINPRHD